MSSSKPTSWEHLGDYHLLGEFARGKSCVLQLGVHTDSSPGPSLRAVKMPLPIHAEDPQFANLLVSEAQLLACLQHPNVVSAYGFGRERGGYVALDYVEGEDLRSLLAHAQTPPDPRIVTAIIADVLQGLDAIHAALGELGDPLRAVHQAPHARHILVGIDGRARLCDLSHARVQRPTSEKRRPSRLDLAYRAPEQVLTPDQVDPRTDLFVLGIALWEALTGRSLFGADDTQRGLLTASIAPPSRAEGAGGGAPREDRPEVAALDAVSLRALERDPALRFASAKEMLEAVLDAALSIGGIALPAEVGRWVEEVAEPTLRARRDLIAGHLPEVPPASQAQSIPPPAKRLWSEASGRAPGRASERPQGTFHPSKTLAGTGLDVRGPSLQPTVFSDTEPPKSAFRPTRPPSSQPPEAKSAPSSSAPPTVSPTAVLRGQQEAPAGFIDTDGVDVGASKDSASAEQRVRRAPRVTEEYALHPAARSSAPARPRTPSQAANDSSEPPKPGPSSGPPSSSQPGPAVAEGSSAPAEPARRHEPGTSGHPVSGSGSASRSSGPPPVLNPKVARRSVPPPSALPGRPPLLSELLWMSIFAVVTVLLGDSLLRLWFGSPYGNPRVEPVGQEHAP